MIKRVFIVAFSIVVAANSLAQGPPKPIMPVPTKAQMDWHKLEQYAMICFGMSTFNDLEWGYGDTPLSHFAPIGGEIDVEQWVRVCKAAGLKGVLLVAKHHDGFVLWQSKFTEYGVKNTSWRGGKGDIVRDLAKACDKHGLKLGLYLSPWDRNHAQYGGPEYVEYFQNQVQEFMEQYPNVFEYWFDGANGGDGYYGGAREMRKIPNTAQYYDYPRAVKTIKKYSPGAIIFGGTVNDIRWIGNEQGWAGQTNWAMLGGEQAKREMIEELTRGSETGERWLPGEVDVSIRPGWYYHASEDNKVRSLAEMVDIYYNSVGRNASLLLSLCPNRHGRIHPIDSARAIQWYETIRRELRDNVLKGARIEASNIRSSRFSPEKLGDGKYDTYWATDDGVTTGSITFKMGKKQKINRLMLQEYIPLGQRVAQFDVEIGNNGKFQRVGIPEATTTIGYKRILRFRAVEGDALRVNFRRSRGELCINNIEAFLAPNVMVEPSIRRDGQDRVIIRGNDPEVEIYYTTDGSIPMTSSVRYTAPFEFRTKGVIRAIAYDRNYDRSSVVSQRNLDIAQSPFRIVGDDSKVIFDDDPLTAQSFAKPLVIDLGGVYELTGFDYFPDQRRYATGMVSHYVISVGETAGSLKTVAHGQFANIKNNPIEQFVTFAPVKGRYVKFEAMQVIDNQKSMVVGDIAVVTK